MYSPCFIIRRIRRLMRRLWHRHTCLILVLGLLLLICWLCSCFGGCSLFSKSAASFEEFLDTFFIETISQNALDMHYTLADPDARQIVAYTPITLGDVSRSARNSDMHNLQKTYDTLESYSNANLSTELTFSYEILHEYLQQQLALGDYALYQEYLSPYHGVHAELPLLLSEYPFRCQEDVDIYLALLHSLPQYFDSVLSFEQEKANAGLFMSDEACCMIVDACDDFAENGITPFLDTSFSNRISQMPELSEEEKSLYIEENQSILRDEIAPAYRLMARTLSGMLGCGRNTNGLCMYPEGKTYYTLLVQSEVGCEDSMEELFAAIATLRDADLDCCASIAGEDPSLASKTDTFTIDTSDANALLSQLQQQMLADFPKPPENTCEICTIDSALADSLAPAFYITAPLDDYLTNRIYLNTASDYNDLAFFTTLAHESYPGHLYQTVMSYHYGLPDFRSLLYFPGYTEGWATYVEMKSYYYSGADTNLATLLQKSQSVILSLYATSDIGVHYYGWSKEDLAAFWKDYGVTDADTLAQIYRLVLYEPGNYLRYYVGYLKFEALKKEVQNTEGSDFDEKVFHETLLRMGPAPFSLLEKYYDVFRAACEVNTTSHLPESHHPAFQMQNAISFMKYYVSVSLYVTTTSFS